MTGRTGWRLSLEPVGDAVAWSLFRRGDGPAVELVGAGLLPGLGDLRRRAAAALPERGADPWTGPLVDRTGERELAGLLGPALLPGALTEALLAAPADPVRHTVTIAARGWLAPLPWDAVGLTRSAGLRLAERARVLGGLPPGLRRPVTAQRPPPDPAAPPGGLAVIDPGPVAAEPRPIYPGTVPDLLLDGIDGCTEAGDGGCDPEELGRLLRSTRWSRLLYLGHLRAGEEDRPASAALVLARAGQPAHLSARQWLAEPAVWPAPPRVALLGCGGDDSGPAEHAGLTTAAVNAGADLVTTTRWTLPTDRALVGETGTTRLAVAVAGALAAADPLDALRRWQLDQLDRWRATGHGEHAPVLWSALVSYLAEGAQDGC